MGTGDNRILLVDDQTAILNYIEGHLTARGFDVIPVRDPEVALDKLEERPSAVFLDIDLGYNQVDGLSLLRRIRAMDQKVPVCMLTGDDTSDTLYQCFMAGADDYICKGFKRPGVIECILRVIENLSEPPPPIDSDAIMNSSILNSRGVGESHLEFLSTWVRHDMPDVQAFADILGVSYNSVVKRFSRIEQQLNLKNRAALVKLLAVIGCLHTRALEEQKTKITNTEWPIPKP